MLGTHFAFFYNAIEKRARAGMCDSVTVKTKNRESLFKDLNGVGRTSL